MKQFHPERWEFEEATRELKFTKDFNPALEAIIRDSLATIGERVLAWIKRRAWGNFHLYCVKDNGQPAFQVDCAAELGIDKRRVSATVKYLVARGYVEVRAKLLYPAISPCLGGPPPDSSEKSEEYRTFLQIWNVAHSVDSIELEVARSTVARIRKVRLSDYKQWRASRTNSCAVKEESLRVIERAGSPSAGAISDDSATVAPVEKTSPLEAEILAKGPGPSAAPAAERPSPANVSVPALDDPEVALLTEALAEYDPLAEPSGAKRLLEACRRNASEFRPAVTGAEVAAVCREKVQRKGGLAKIRDPIAFFLVAVPPCFPSVLAILRKLKSAGGAG